MIRTVVTPQNTDLHLSIPKDYIGKQIEVLLFPMDEPMETSPVKKIQWQKYKGIVSAGRAEEMQKYVTQSRNEWERNT